MRSSWYPFFLHILCVHQNKNLPWYWSSHEATSRCLTSPASRCNFRLLDVCSFLIKYLCSLKVAGSREVYNKFPQLLGTIKWSPNFLLTSPTHQFSINNCVPLSIHRPWHPTHAQSPKTCWKNLQLPPSVKIASQIHLLTSTFDTRITPPTLTHILRDCSMWSIPLS